VRLRSGKDPVLYLADPAGIEREGRREMLDALQALNKVREEAYHDPEIDTRIQQYEMAFKMQTSVPELTDLSKEPASTFELYGEDARKPGTYAANPAGAATGGARRAVCAALSQGMGPAQ